MRRLLRGDATDAKLIRLRRLQRQYVLCDVPRYPETRVEQSFNEQLFANVFDYRTLYSHDAVPFHLHPKDAMGRRYNDFSLGFFGTGSDTVIASAELKSSNADLDEPQNREQRETAVQQAIDTALSRANTCRWALVCNYRELRLYDVRTPSAAIAVADLHRIRQRTDLAVLLAHFDRRALLPDDSTEAEMTTMLDSMHPQSPVPPASACYRIVFRHALGVDRTFPLFQIERALIAALRGAPRAEELFIKERGGLEKSLPPIRMSGGWVSTEAENSGTLTRFAMSRYGETQLSVRESHANGTSAYELQDYNLRRAAWLFAQIMDRVYRTLQLPSMIDAVIGAELLDVHNKRMWLALDSRSGSIGTREAAQIEAGDFRYSRAGLADCLCELAIHFRSSDGAGLALDRAKVSRELDDEIRSMVEKPADPTSPF
jgi:hypothetical protein